jgi:hypothetical protein
MRRDDERPSVIFDSSNGHEPKTGQWGRDLYKAMSGLHVEVASFATE